MHVEIYRAYVPTPKENPAFEEWKIACTFPAQGEHMNQRQDVRATVCAALVIIGFSLSALRCSETRRAVQRKFMEQAVDTWEDEGGLVVDKEENENSAAVR
jgi:hypothetical protein